MTPMEFHPKESDDRAAPFVFAYIVGVMGWIAAIIVWVYWINGYA